MRTGWKFALAGVIGALAAGLWLARPVSIDRERADAIAGRVLAGYVAEQDEFAGHFAVRPTVGYRDGWDYRWAYLPCPDVAELRVFVSVRGSASITTTPDCDAKPGADAPVLV